MTAFPPRSSASCMPDYYVISPNLQDTILQMLKPSVTLTNGLYQETGNLTYCVKDNHQCVNMASACQVSLRPLRPHGQLHAVRPMVHTYCPLCICADRTGVPIGPGLSPPPVDDKNKTQDDNDKDKNNTGRTDCHTCMRLMPVATCA